MVQFPEKYQSRIFLHSQFPKFHLLKELENSPPEGGSWKGAEYAFLSPIFDSISKAGYKSKFDLHELKNSPLLARRGVGGEVFALGGIDEHKIDICRQLGFAGVAVLGTIWNNKNPIEKFLRIKEKCQKKDLVF